MIEGKTITPQCLEMSIGKGRTRIKCTAISVGKDLAVHIQGGDQPHIGAVAMAVPRPSLKQATKMSATASILVVTGHKDDEIARSVSLYLAAELSCVAVVVAGVHIDNAEENEITEILSNSRQATQVIIEALRRKGCV